MNAKLAKKLRQSARRLAAGQRYRHHVSAVANSRVIADGHNADGTPKVRKFVYTGTVQNSPKSERGLYRMMKKGAQAEARRHAK